MRPSRRAFQRAASARSFGKTFGGFAWALSLVFALACRGETKPTEEADRSIAAKGASLEPAVPLDRAAFGALVAPVPGAAVEVRYALEGPAGVSGELRMESRPGGWRASAWKLLVPQGQPPVVRGRELLTPRVAWSAPEGGKGMVQARTLGPLLDAYEAAPEALRLEATQAVQNWTRELEKARASDPGERDTIAGQSCVKMSIAARELCLWEEAGLVLNYRSEQLKVRATKVILHAELPAKGLDFTLPEEAAELKPELKEFDGTRALAEIAGGRLESLATLATPGLGAAEDHIASLLGG